jgi:hypothetical protein
VVHQEQLLKIAREGGRWRHADLAKFEPQRRYGPGGARHRGMAVTGEIIACMTASWASQCRQNKHQQQFQASGKAINAKVRLFGRIGQALIEAKQARRAIRSPPSRPSCPGCFRRASPKRSSSRNRDFDFLHRIGELRHAAPLRAGISTCSSCGPRPPPKDVSTPSRCCAA